MGDLTMIETVLVITYITDKLVHACLCVQAHDAHMHPRAHDDIIIGILGFGAEKRR